MPSAVVEGQALVAEIEYRVEGVLTDPVVVRCLVRKPNGVFVELAYPSADLIRRSVGVYEASIVADQAGTWAFRATGVGGVDAVGEIATTVEKSLVL